MSRCPARRQSGTSSTLDIGRNDARTASQASGPKGYGEATSPYSRKASPNILDPPQRVKDSATPARPRHLRMSMTAAPECPAVDHERDARRSCFWVRDSAVQIRHIALRSSRSKKHSPRHAPAGDRKSVAIRRWPWRISILDRGECRPSVFPRRPGTRPSGSQPGTPRR